MLSIELMADKDTEGACQELVRQQLTRIHIRFHLKQGVVEMAHGARG